MRKKGEEGISRYRELAIELERVCSNGKLVRKMIFFRFSLPDGLYCTLYNRNLS